jgi:hypothetical protein
MKVAEVEEAESMREAENTREVGAESMKGIRP